MNNENNDIPEDLAHGSEVTVYGQNSGAEDFPVLKAFQQYIDAEQAKSRKRLVTICILFGVLMLIVVVGFMVMLMSANSRTQQLNDRLMDFALRQQQPQPIASAVPSAPSPAASAESAELARVNSALAALERKVLAAGSSGSPLPIAESEELAALRRERQALQDAERQRVQNDKFAAERRKLEAERAALKEQERQLQLRRLYPECYDENGRLIERTPSRTAVRRQATAVPRRVETAAPSRSARVETAASSRPAGVAEPKPIKFDTSKSPSEDNAMTFFDEADEAEPVTETKPAKKAEKPADDDGSRTNLKVNLNGNDAGWEIPID